MEFVDIFLQDIKKTYRTLFGSVLPVLSEKSNVHSLDDVFVDTKIECFRHSRWIKLNSYQEVLTKDSDPITTVIKGGAGYGKSTLALRFVYDWCNKSESFPKQIKILIFLRLRQLGGVASITKAIKKFVLPKDTSLEERNVEAILESESSILFILDGWDEFSDIDKIPVENDIVKKIISRFDVVLTSRPVPHLIPKNAKQIKLRGFNEEARQNYIRKIVKNDPLALETIRDHLSRNEVVDSLCEIPLFFVMFVHMINKCESLKRVSRVTEFFKYALEQFHIHMELKSREPNVQKYPSYQENHLALDRIAFRELTVEEKLIWPKKYLSENLGQDFLDQYLRIGVLVEEEVDENCNTHSLYQCKTHVKFYHTVFCEWYAACFLAKQADLLEYHEFRKFLSTLKFAKTEYLFRFACGLSRNGSNKIIRFVKSLDKSEKLAILCILERSGATDSILDIVKDLCSKDIFIDGEDSKMLHVATIQFTKVAAKEEAPISRLILNGSFDHTSHDVLFLRSGLKLPVISTLRNLRISEPGKEFTKKEILPIFNFCEKCRSIESLEFNECLLPKTIGSIDVEWRPPKVVWQPRRLVGYPYLLNSKGYWKTNYYEESISNEEYKRVQENFKEDYLC